MPGAKRIYTAGEKEYLTWQYRKSRGVPLNKETQREILAMREELGLHAATKGAMVAPMTIIDNGDTINLGAMGSGGWAVPSIVEADVIQFVKSDAKFVLLIEKDAVWVRFNKDRFWEKHHCAIIHGGGQPPRGVRRLIHRMHMELKLPVYVLVDNDPWGYYIYSVVKQGSINLAFESQRMAIPKAKFIGLSSADPESYGLPRNVGIKLNEKDTARARELLNYHWFQKKPWQEEIKRMLASGLKYELDALANKDFQYLTKRYLPRKLKEKDVTLALAKRLKARLEARTRATGITAALTRSDDSFLTVSERTTAANTADGDIFISIHCNAYPDPSASGVETYYLSKARSKRAMMVAARENGIPLSRMTDLEATLVDLMVTSKKSESEKLAHTVHESLTSTIHLPRCRMNRGVRQAPFYVLLGVTTPAVLVECGYMSNSKESARLASPHYLDLVAEGIARGAESYVKGLRVVSAQDP